MPDATKRDKSATIHVSKVHMVPIGDLKANPSNPNKHPASQIELMAEIIRHQGWRSAIVVSKRSGFVVVGHGRLEAARKLGLDKVPVHYQEFATHEDEIAHMLADNKLAELASFDLALADVALQSLGDVVAFSGFTLDEAQAVHRTLNGGDTMTDSAFTFEDTDATESQRKGKMIECPNCHHKFDSSKVK